MFLQFRYNLSINSDIKKLLFEQIEQFRINLRNKLSVTYLLIFILIAFVVEKNFDRDRPGMVFVIYYEKIREFHVTLYIITVTHLVARIILAEKKDERHSAYLNKSLRRSVYRMATCLACCLAVRQPSKGETQRNERNARARRFLLFVHRTSRPLNGSVYV